MTLPIYVVDAFTSEPFRGNPAAVVVGTGEEAWMQRVAAEMRHSETAFLAPHDDGSFGLRWFSPRVEVDLCGHATLASAHILFETGRLAPGATARFHTRSGELRAEHAGHAGVTIDLPSSDPVATAPIPELFEALGLPPGELLRVDGDFYLCVVDRAAIVRELAPDIERLRALTGVRGVYVTAPGDGGYDIVSRCFGPRVGIDEDPVTGSMHAYLAAFWAPRLGKDELRAYQASARGGELTVRRVRDRAFVTGHAVTVLAGELRA